MKKGYNGNFGVSSKRFGEEVALQDVPGPGTYDELEAQKPGLKQKLTSVFVSKSNRMELTNPTSRRHLSSAVLICVKMRYLQWVHMR